MIKFGAWLPDQPDLNNSGVTIATNVVPAANGYRSFPGFNQFSNAADYRIRGIFAAKDASDAISLFAGDKNKLYKFNQSNSNLGDASKSGTPAYTLAGVERWRFVQFGETVLAAGGVNNNLQKFLLGTDTAFSDLSGTPPKADYIAVVRDQVFCANIDEGSGRKPFRVRWSGLNDETSWTTGTDQSDFQDVFGGDVGSITGLVGGESATIFMENGIAVAYYVGSPLIYQFDLVETSRGCPFPGSVASVGGLSFYLSRSGFFSFDGKSSQPIGAEAVNEFFLADFDSAQTDKISAAVDPSRQIVCWSYVSVNAPDDTPDRILVYNYALQKWSLVETQAELIVSLFTPSYTLDALDNLASSIDSLPAPLDSSIYKGGEHFFGGSRSNKIFGFTGTPLAGTIETSEFMMTQGRHSLMTRTVPYFEGGNVTMQVAARDRQDDTATFDTATALTDEGFCEHRVQGRYHKVRMNLAGEWDFALGLDVEGSPIGRR